MWRLSGHHLLAANLLKNSHQRSTRYARCTTHPAAPSSMQHVHVGSAMHHTCTAARGSMAQRMYLQCNHAARGKNKARPRRTHWLSGLHSHADTVSMHTKEATTRRLATARMLSFMSTHEATYLIGVNAKWKTMVNIGGGRLQHAGKRTCRRERTGEGPRI
jgi:hypothetical protein